MLLMIKPSEEWSIAKKIQYYLCSMGFDTGGVDGLFGVKSSSSIILLQYYLGSCKVDGMLNNITLNIVKTAADGGLKYAEVKGCVEDKWRRLKPSVETGDLKKNGHLSTANMVRIPTSRYEIALAEKETAIAWAMLVKYVNEYNNIVKTNSRLDVNNFAAAGTYAAYRPYHYQVEAYINYRHGGNPAACPAFTNGAGSVVRANRFNANNKIAEAWISDNWNCFINNGEWNNVPENVTAAGGALEGYGCSDHGWGIAIDFCTGGEKLGRSYDREVRWLEQNAHRFGFFPLLDDPHTFPDGANNYKESWHWSYNDQE